MRISHICLLGAMVLLTACGGKSGNETSATSSDELIEGMNLINQYDCKTCHHPTNKIVGPPYQEIAAKYTEADVDKIAQHVIAGGAGAWGTVPMNPHPDLPVEDAKKMVRYILSLKAPQPN